MYRGVLLGAVSSVALISSAFAADIYTPSVPAYAVVALPPTWGGFYIGVNGGYGGDSGLGYREDVYDVTNNYTYASVPGATTITGGFGGGQLGYNWQFGSLVAGLETDIEGSNIQGSGETNYFTAPLSTANFCGMGGNSAYPCVGKNDVDVDWFGTARGRLGYAFGGTLLYVTGGFAYGGVTSSTVYNDYSAANTRYINGRSSSSTTQTGWVAGAGIEVKLSPSWTLKGEYQYIDLGSASTGSETAYQNTVLSCPTAATHDCLTLSGKNNEVAFNTVRVGVNYLFNAPEPLPLK